MTLANKLIAKPQREKSGSLVQERFDYQALWGLALIFKNHEGEDDYAVAFEFHDDVILLDSATEPTKIRFYQVKTKERGHWTMADLFRRPPLKAGQVKADRGNSHIGKLFGGLLAFPDETAEMGFVSNAPLEFADANADITFKNCDEKVFTKFLEKLKLEHPSASEDEAALISYVKADLSLDDSSTHAKGKLHNFVVQSLGEVPYNLDSLFRAIVEDCRTRSKYTGPIHSFEDLLRFKAITRRDVEGWLATLSLQASLPDWEAFANELSVSSIRKLQMRVEWKTYRSKVLDAGDEGIRVVRREIMKNLEPIIDSDSSLDDYMVRILPKVRSLANANISPCSDEKIMVMILYEVIYYASTRAFQDSHPQSEN